MVEGAEIGLARMSPSCSDASAYGVVSLKLSLVLVSFPLPGFPRQLWLCSGQDAYKTCCCSRCMWMENSGKARVELRDSGPGFRLLTEEDRFCCSIFRSTTWQSLKKPGFRLRARRVTCLPAVKRNLQPWGRTSVRNCQQTHRHLNNNVMSVTCEFWKIKLKLTF